MAISIRTAGRERRMPAARRRLGLAASVAFVLAAPGAPGAAGTAGTAGTATVTTPACVRTVDSVGRVPIRGTGFTPGASVTIRSSPSGVLTSVTTDAAGGFATTTGNPAFTPYTRQLQTFRLTATDDMNPAVVATTAYKQVRVGYLTKPATGPATVRATHTVRGLLPGRFVFLHFRFRGQTKRDVRVGRADSPCGVASRRMALLPTRSRPGRWTVYADESARFSITTKPQLKYAFTIRRTGI